MHLDWYSAGVCLLADGQVFLSTLRSLPLDSLYPINFPILIKPMVIDN